MGQNVKTARLILMFIGDGNKAAEQDPRSIAQRAEKHLKTQGCDYSFWGPDRVFCLDKIQWQCLTPYKGPVHIQ